MSKLKIEEAIYISIRKSAANIGPKGDNGEDGKSAYQVALENGFLGTEIEWLESLNPLSNILGFNTMIEAEIALGLGKFFYYNESNLDGATAGSVHVTI